MARKTVRPRISFVPTVQVQELLEELAVLSGQSKASLASEMLDEVVPVIRGQIEALKKVAGRPEEARKWVEDYAQQAVRDISQAVLDLDTPNKPRKIHRRAAGG